MDGCMRDYIIRYFPLTGRVLSDGVDADVIFYPMMTQYVDRVAGWGADGGKDDYGRPLILMMGWSAPTGIDDYTDTVARRKAIDACAGGASCDEVYPPPASKVDAAWAGMAGAWRALILHELVHGLGFNIFEMQDIQEADGTKRQLVRRQEMVDPDGTKDEVWLGFGRTVALYYTTLPLIHFIPDSRTYSAPLFLKRNDNATGP